VGFLARNGEDPSFQMAEPILIRLRENGPLVVMGPVRIVDHMGNEFTIPPGKDNVALCRCGASDTKPFCDGTHRVCGFVAANLASAPQIPPKP
jgi:CDGSH-type Zn-finger protein